MAYTAIHIMWWYCDPNRYGIGPVIQSSWVQSHTILLSCSSPWQNVYSHVPLFTKHYKLVPLTGSDTLKLEGNRGLAESNGSQLLGS